MTNEREPKSERSGEPRAVWGILATFVATLLLLMPAFVAVSPSVPRLTASPSPASALAHPFPATPPPPPWNVTFGIPSGCYRIQIVWMNGNSSSLTDTRILWGTSRTTMVVHWTEGSTTGGGNPDTHIIAPSSLTLGLRYYFAVQDKNASGWSGNSSIITSQITNGSNVASPAAGVGTVTGLSYHYDNYTPGFLFVTWNTTGATLGTNDICVGLYEKAANATPISGAPFGGFLLEEGAGATGPHSYFDVFSVSPFAGYFVKFFPMNVTPTNVTIGLGAHENVSSEVVWTTLNSNLTVSSGPPAPAPLLSGLAPFIGLLVFLLLAVGVVDYIRSRRRPPAGSRR